MVSSQFPWHCSHHVKSALSVFFRLAAPIDILNLLNKAFADIKFCLDRFFQEQVCREEGSFGMDRSESGRR